MQRGLSAKKVTRTNICAEDACTYDIWIHGTQGRCHRIVSACVKYTVRGVGTVGDVPISCPEGVLCILSKDRQIEGGGV